jgi:hypothetical protein
MSVKELRIASLFFVKYESVALFSKNFTLVYLKYDILRQRREVNIRVHLEGLSGSSS